MVKEKMFDIPKVDFLVTKEKKDEKLRELCKKLVKEWSDVEDEKIDVSRLTGGVTNELFKLRCKEVDEKLSVLVRLYGYHTESFIDREKELKWFSRLSSIGFAPTLYGRFNNGYVYGFIPGQVFTEADMAKIENGRDVVAEIARWSLLHITSDIVDLEEGVQPVCISGSRKMIKNAYEAYKERPDVAKKLQNFFSLEELEKEVEAYEAILKEKGYWPTGPDSLCRLVFSHNDLLCGNILRRSEDGGISFIDFEYCGFNPRGYDIANHYNEFRGFEVSNDAYPSKEFRMECARVYVEEECKLLKTEMTPEKLEEETRRLHDAVEVWRYASDLMWGCWSILQSAYSQIDFDYVTYAKLRINGFREGLKLLSS